MADAERLCIWNNRALFMGYLTDFGMRRQGAAALCVGLDRDFSISLDGQDWISCRTALTAPLTNHTIRFSEGYCALLFIDVHTADFAHLAASNKENERDGVYVSLCEETVVLRTLEQIRTTSRVAEIRGLLDQLAFGGGAESQNNPDARLMPVIEHLLADVTQNTPAEELAQLAQLSLSGLEHLFRQQMGIPLRLFRNWFRLKTAVLAISQGKSLTEAALLAGFFDSAHFTRTFKDTFGLPPSEIFSPKRQLQWFIDV